MTGCKIRPMAIMLTTKPSCNVWFATISYSTRIMVFSCAIGWADVFTLLYTSIVHRTKPINFWFASTTRNRAIKMYSSVMEVSSVFNISNQKQIFNSVVGPVFIQMVNTLVGLKRSPKMPFHNYTMVIMPFAVDA